MQSLFLCMQNVSFIAEAALSVLCIKLGSHVESPDLLNQRRDVHVLDSLGFVECTIRKKKEKENFL